MKGDRFQKKEKKKEKNLLDGEIGSNATKLTLMVYYQVMTELLKRYQLVSRVYYKNHKLV
jgi:hypothetical protein